MCFSILFCLLCHQVGLWWACFNLSQPFRPFTVSFLTLGALCIWTGGGCWSNANTVVFTFQEIRTKVGVLRPSNTRGQPTSGVRNKLAHICAIMWHAIDSDLNSALSIMTPTQAWCQCFSQRIKVLIFYLNVLLKYRFFPSRNGVC